MSARGKQASQEVGDTPKIWVEIHHTRYLRAQDTDANNQKAERQCRHTSHVKHRNNTRI